MAIYPMRYATATRMRPLLRLQIILAVLLFSFPSHSLIADSFSDRRVHVGLKLFRTLVNADLEAEQKLDPDGKLPIFVVYTGDDSDAQEYQQSLTETLTTVRELPVHIQLLKLDKLPSLPGKPAALFLAQPLNPSDLQQLVDYSIAKHVIVFSPFDGDVEKGVLAGLSVEARVRPLINMHTLKASQVSIKAFYLQVAKHYE